MFSRFLHKHPFLIFLVPLAIGIMGGEIVPETWFRAGCYFIVSIAVILAACYRLPAKHSWIFACLLTLFLAGSGAVLSHQPRPDLPPQGEHITLKGRCAKVFAYPDKYAIQSGNSSILLQTPDSTSLSPGDSVMFQAWVFPLAEKQHFHDFDYDKYLFHQKIQAKAYPRSEIQVIGHSADVHSTCHALRQKLVEKLHRVLPDSLTRSMVEALCLGYLADIHPRTEELFQTTGTIHILSVSGLHMGIIYAFFSVLFKMAGIRSPKYRLLLIPVLWFFTCLSGMSSPACRAAIILSMLLIGQAFHKDYIPLNIVAASAFFSLLVNPHLLYSVSFQMSYAAYTGIVVLFPLLRRQGQKLPLPLKWCYDMICLSFAAQILIVPLTAYYFHTINVNSVLINLVAIPLSTWLLYAGIILLSLPVSIGALIAPAVTFMNKSLFFSLEQFQEYACNLTQIYPTGLHVILVYLLLALSLLYLRHRKTPTLRWLCGTLLLLVVFHSAWSHHRSHRQEIIIFHHYGRSTILLNYHGFYSFLKYTGTDTVVPHYVLANGLAPIPRSAGFTNSDIRFASNRLLTKQDTLQIIDRDHPASDLSGCLIVTDNIFPPAQKHTAMPRHVILDNSNSRRCQKEWLRFCTQHAIPLSTTETSGSIRVPL